MKMLLGRQWVDREKKIDVCDPFDNAVIDTVPAATTEDVETALATAASARATARAASRASAPARGCGGRAGTPPAPRSAA